MLMLDKQTEALLQARARALGRTPDALVRDLLGVPVPPTQPPDLAAMQALARRVAALPLLDTRSQRQIADEGWGD
jgi:hypothetical protein